MIHIFQLHIFCAFLSLTLVIIRGSMQFSGKHWRNIKLLRILPHLSDTLLIISGITIFSYFSFDLSYWLISKILLLGLYIILSAKAFTKSIKQPKFTTWLLSCLTLITAISVAYYH